MRCTFCHRSAPGKWALTVCKGDPDSLDSWRREIAPVCLRCNRLLRDAGRQGSESEGYRRDLVRRSHHRRFDAPLNRSV